MDPTKGFTLTPGIIRVLQNVPVEEVEEALRKSFPLLFDDALKPQSTVERIRQLPISEPVKSLDVMAEIRRMRDEEHI